MDYKKIVKPLSRITLLVATSSIIFGIVRLFQGSDDWGLVEAFIITPICVYNILVCFFTIFGEDEQTP